MRNENQEVRVAAGENETWAAVLCLLFFAQRTKVLEMQILKEDQHIKKGFSSKISAVSQTGEHSKKH